MKLLFIFLISGCLITSCCSAQVIEDDVKVPGTQPKVPTVAVTFIANDTCNLKVNGVDRGDIVKNSSKTIPLPYGNHRLFFESQETGETIKKRSFRLIRDSITGGKFIYPVTFKKQNL